MMNPTEPHAPFLVMAHHRSGSNFLNDLLQQHRGIECLNEPLSMHTRFFRDHDLEPWQAQDYDAELLHPSLAQQPLLRDYLLELRQYLLCSRQGRIIGFKDTCLFGKLGWLKAYLPGLKIIFLRRDARAIVSSVLRSKLSGLWRYADLVPPAFAQLCPHYASRVDPGDVALRAAETAAMSVALRYESARRTLGLFEHMTLDLDELTREPAPRLRALADFLGSTAEAEPLGFIRARQSESRGGPFSSCRSIDDVEAAWQRHLSARQLEVIEAVLRAPHDPTAIGAMAGHA